jgi:glutamyl-tRNA synthetase
MITRFAPSPTGFLHLGSYRTAIFNYLFTRQQNGIFILRIEDTDKVRSKKEYEDNIIKSLHWLGLNYDKFFRQSENVARHKFYLEKMIQEGSAYLSREPAKDSSGILKEIIRFKNPNIDIIFQDLIKGEVKMNTTDLGDFVLAQGFHAPLFHLAAVVDDFEEGVTHVVRGEDHTSNTARQILIQRAIGAPTPIYAHLPLVLGMDKLKLSKRRGALPVTNYQELGFLPEAILNFITFVGWNPGTDQEIFSQEELIQAFDFSKVQKSPAILNEKKLEWFNKEYMKKLKPEEIENQVLAHLPKNMRETKIVPLIFERISKWNDVTTMAERGELDLFFKEPILDKEKIIFKDSLPEKIFNNLNLAIETLKTLDSENFTQENIKEKLMPIANSLSSRGEFLHPIRFALSGLDKSPDPFVIAQILGKNETLKRLKTAALLISQ